MARIRTINPEFWDSPSTAKASPWARLLFIAMWNWADDYGRGTANLKELEGFAFPNDDDFKDSSGNTVHFSELVAEVSECFGVVLYEVDNRRYYEIPSWDTHQRNERRAKQSKYPSPLVSGHKAEMPEGVAEIPYKSTETPNISGAGTGEQGNRGTGEQGNRGTEIKDSLTGSADEPLIEAEIIEEPKSQNRFEEFWSAYPRKVGKQKAITKYKAAINRATPEEIIDGAHRLANDPNLPEQQFIPHATTWLERNGWEDEPLPIRFRTKSEERIEVGREIATRAMNRPKMINPFES